MGRIWKYGMILFIVASIVNHQEEELMNAIFDTPFLTYQFVLTLILSACLWNGFLNIIEVSGFMNYFSFCLKPLLRFIYGDIIYEKGIYDSLSSNILANLLGLGTLATMSGLNAFRQLNKYHQQPYPSKQMLTLIIINTVGLSLFPSSLIMIRKQYHSQNIYAFYPYMILISLLLFIIGLFIQRLIDHE